MLKTDDIRRILETKELNGNVHSRRDSIGSNESDRSDLSTQSMPQYSSYRALSGGLFGPFEKATRPNSRLGFLNWTSKIRSPEMSHTSKLKTPSRPSSRTSSVADSSKLPVFRRESSMPHIKRESSIPQIRREKSDLKSKATPAKTSTSSLKTPTPRSTTGIKPPVPAVPRGTNIQIVPHTTPKNVVDRKIEERNISAKGTRSGVSGFSNLIMIGDRVSISGTDKVGVVQFVGETKFAKGVWAGIVLDDASGKNDGSVSGVRYFSCPKLHGVFVKEEKLVKVGDPRDPGFSPHSTPMKRASVSTIPSKSTLRNDSSLSTDSGVEDAVDLVVGDSVVISSVSGDKIGTLRYIGQTGFAKGTWCGVELSDASGKNDGAVAGTRYFQCESKHGIFAQIHKVKKLNSSDESISPVTLTKKNATQKQLDKSSSFHDDEGLPSDTESTVKAVEVAILNNDAMLTSSTPSGTISSIVEQNLNHTIDEQAKKIASLELQLYKKDEELQRLIADNRNTQNEEFEQKTFEYQENILKLQQDIGKLEKEKLEYESKANEQKQQLEDIQFQLEEQLMLANEEEKPLANNLENVLGLEEKLNIKQTEIDTLKGDIKKTTTLLKDSEEKLLEKEAQLSVKSEEISSLRELNNVAKNNEGLLNTEISNLKQQLMEVKSTNSSVKEVESKYENVRADYESRILERDRKVSDMQDEIIELNRKYEKLQSTLQEKEGSGEEYKLQLTSIRKELNESIETQKLLNTQIVDLNNDLGLKRKEIQTCQATIDQLKSENLDMKAKLEASVSRNLQLIDEKKQLEDDIIKASKNSGDNAQQLVHLNEQLQNKNREITTLQEKLASLTAEIKKMSHETENLKDKFSKEKNSIEKEKQEGIAKLKASLQVMENHYQQLKTENQAIEESSKKEKLELQNSSNLLENLNEQNKSKDEKITLKENEILSLSDQLNKLTKLNTKNEEELSCTSLKVKCQANEIETLQQSLKELKDKENLTRTDLEKLNKDFDKLNREKSNYERLNEALNSEIEKVKKEKEEVSKTCENILLKAEKISKEKENLHSAEKNMSNELELLKKEKEEISKKYEKSLQIEKEKDERLAAIEKQMSDGSATSKDLLHQLEKSRDEVTGLKESFKNLEKEKGDLLKKNLELINERDSLQNDFQGKQMKEEEIQSQCSILRDQLQQALDRESTVRTKLEKDCVDLRNEANLNSKRADTLDKEVIHLNAKIVEMETKNQQLQKSNIQVSSSGSDSILTNQLRELNDQKLEKEKEVDFLNSIIVDLQEKNRKQEEKIKLLCFGEEETSYNVDNNNDTMSPMKPGIRIRMFCDICDKFDLHDTEDCPLQCSDDVGTQNHGDRNTERPYCTTCEMFGHTAENCDDEEMF